MSSVPEHPDETEIIALIEKLRPAPQRDPQAAANGRSNFLTEARTYRAWVSARQEGRHIERKEIAMRGLHLSPFVSLVIVLGVVVFIGFRMMLGPVIGNTFSTINSSLTSIGGSSQQPPAHAIPTAAPSIFGPGGASPQPTSGAAIPGPQGQKIVKNADIRLLVKDTDRALDGVTQAVADVQGYMISSRTWFQPYDGKNYKYATLTIAVPVDQFENTMRRLRSLAVQVLDENASGEDVTNQYVDLQSQVTNLEGERDRIRTFLSQATNVDDVLRLDLELSRVEGQIEQLKGQMNYLSNRAAFSTITINLEPQLPKLVPAPTPTATPLPPQGLGPWDPGVTAMHASDAVISTYRLVADFLIWVFVGVVPIIAPPALLVWLVVWLIRRRERAATKGQAA